MISISGVQDAGVREYQAAIELQTLILKAWPQLRDSQQDHITIVVGAKCHGQIVRDIDLILLGTIKSGIIYKPFLSFTTRDGNPLLPDEVEIESLCLVIELKDHSSGSVRFTGSQVEVRYQNQGIWHNASIQTENQKQSLINYLRLQGFDHIPWITPLIWLPNVLNRDLPRRPHNILGGDSSWDLFVNVISQMSPPRFYANRWVLGVNYPSINDIDQIKDVLTKTIEPTTIDRQRMEQINQRAADELNLQEQVGNLLLILRGRGGTGKTIRLLQLAKRLYDERAARILILTYNRALVADLRRLLTLMGISDGIAERSIQIQTIHSFFYALMKELGIVSTQERDFLDKYINFKCELLELIGRDAINARDLQDIKQHNVETFAWDFIFIDEGQDWPDDERDLLFHLYPPQTFAIADGIDQLIREQSPANWRNTLTKNQARIIPLKKCLRMKSGLTRFVSSVAGELGLQQSEWTANELVPGGRVVVVEGNEILEVQTLLSNWIDQTRQAGNMPVDMLFCVPPNMVIQDQDGQSKSVIGNLFKQWGWSVWDGVSSSEREAYPTDINQLRIVQYESCRGLEGWTTVLFGLDDFHNYKKQQLSRSELDASQADLQAARWLLIPLTRAMDTIVIHIRSENSRLAKILRSILPNYPGVIEWHKLFQ